jgi:hypothetical protein
MTNRSALYRKIFTADLWNSKLPRVVRMQNFEPDGAPSPFGSKMKCKWTVRTKFKQICFYINAHKQQIILPMFWEELIRKMRATQSDTSRNTCRVFITLCTEQTRIQTHALLNATTSFICLEDKQVNSDTRIWVQ